MFSHGGYARYGLFAMTSTRCHVYWFEPKGLTWMGPSRWRHSDCNPTIGQRNLNDKRFVRFLVCTDWKCFPSLCPVEPSAAVCCPCQILLTKKWWFRCHRKQIFLLVVGNLRDLERVQLSRLWIVFTTGWNLHRRLILWYKFIFGEEIWVLYCKDKTGKGLKLVVPAKTKSNWQRQVSV